MNSEAFLSGQAPYFAAADERLLSFGGPSVYFHQECPRAGDAGFLSERHLEMLYATLTAWGMHRMGDAGKTKAKIAEWGAFRDSLLRGGLLLGPVRTATMLAWASSCARDHTDDAVLRTGKRDSQQPAPVVLGLSGAFETPIELPK